MLEKEGGKISIYAVRDSVTIFFQLAWRIKLLKRDKCEALFYVCICNDCLSTAGSFVSSRLKKERIDAESWVYTDTCNIVIPKA